MRLIIIDGLDAVGKDTHADLICKRYQKMGEKVIIRSHPESDNYFGRKTKMALLGNKKSDKLTASFFYIFDVLRSIKKYYHKNEYDTVIMVRYLMGTAYLPDKLAIFAYNIFEHFVPVSDYMFFLDAQPSELVKRVETREEKEIFETYEELVKVRKKALKLVRNWNLIDTSESIEDTFFKIEKILDKLDKKTC